VKIKALLTALLFAVLPLASLAQIPPEALPAQADRPNILVSPAAVIHNQVYLTIKPGWCAKLWTCGTLVKSLNSRVDAGAAFVANNLSNPASVTTSVEQYIAFSGDATAVAKTDVICASELTTNGMGRKIATFGSYTAPSSLGGTFSYTLTNSYNATGAYSINKLCLFNAVSAGTMLFETLLGATVSGGNGDTINVTWTVTGFLLPLFFLFRRRRWNQILAEILG
jgi:hypothetical protein